MKLVKSDISAVGSAVESALSYEVSDADKLINAINDFTSESVGRLSGDIWVSEMRVFEGYISILNTRKQIALDLLNSMRLANNIMDNYIDGFPDSPDRCDTALIPELEAKIASLRQQIESLLEQSRRTGVSVDVSALYEQLKKFEEILEYLKKLPPTDASAYQKYDSVKSSISSMKSNANSLKVSSIS